MTESKVISSFVVLISLLGAGFCGYLLYYDMYIASSSIDGLSQAGLVAAKSQTVKRKLGDNMVWELVHANEKLYWNDSIQTGSKSRVDIVLNDGNKISLGEQSLVILEKDNEKLSLNLKSGQVVVDSTQVANKAKTEIKVNGATLSSQTVSLQVDESKGKVTATTAAADGSAKQIIIDDKGHVEEKAIAAVLLSPQPMARRFSVNPNDSVEFSWQAKEAQRKIFELARDKSFKDVIAKKELTDNKLVLDLGPGLYYWRVQVAGIKDQLASETRSFDVIQMHNPEASEPKQGAQFSYRSDIPTVEFKWNEAPASDRYIFEASTDADFKQIVFSSETTNSSLRTSKLAEGRVFWRVKAVYGEQILASKSSGIDLKKLIEITPPQLLFPEKNFSVGFDFFDKSKGIPFRWKAESSETYQFILAHNERLTDEIVAFETTQSDTVIKNLLEPGDYYWSVGHKDLDGKWKYLEARKIIITPLVPLLAAPKILGPDVAEIDLLKNPLLKWSWTEVSGAKEYKFKLVKIDERDEKLILEDVVKATSQEKKDLPDGNYKWSVSSVDSYGRESHPSEYRFSVYHGHQLEAPSFDMTEVQ